MIYKQCKECNEWFIMDGSNFYKHYISSDGFFGTCKLCKAKYQASRKLENKLLNREYRDRHRKTIKERNRTWSENNKEYRKEYYKNYQQKPETKEKFKQYNNKRQQKNHKISKKEWEHCKVYFNNSCAYCGLSAEEHYITYRGELKLSDLHKEHLDDLGANDLSNCIPACKSCNCKKNIFPFNVWYTKDNPVYNEERLHKIIKWIEEDYKLYIKILESFEK